MRNKTQILVDCFLSGNFENFQGASPYSGNINQIFFNDEEIAFKDAHNNVIIINRIASIAVMSCLLNSFPYIDATVKNEQIYINGILWDGKAAKLDLFIN